MTFQRTGMVWHFDTYDELQDTTGIDGVFGHVIGTDGVLVDATYLWIEGPGWIVLWGDTPHVDQFAPSLGGDAARNVLFWDDFTNKLAPSGSGIVGDRLIVDSDGYPNWLTPATRSATPSDPTGTNSTTGVMMGLAVTTTPLTQKGLIIISGDIQNTSGSGGGNVQIRYDIGTTAPANGDALTGTAAGGQPELTQGTVASNKAVPFCLNAIVAVDPEVEMWIDVGLAALNTGTASIKNLSVTFHDF